MRDFERKPGRLRSLSLHARLAYSVFLAFTLVGLGLSAALLHDMVGLDLSGSDAYYAGIEEAPTPTAAAPDDGPAFDLPPETDAPAAPTPLSTRKLLEVTHFHLFSMPVYLLILSHLFMLGRGRAGVKVAVISASSVGVALHMLAPWAAAGSWPGAGALYAVSGLLLAVGLTWMSLVPLWEMWAPTARR